MTRFEFARSEFPKLVDRRLQELKTKDQSATYEDAFRATAKQYADIYEDYTHSVGQD